MNTIRSVIFNFCFYIGSLFWSLALLWTLPLGHKMCARITGSVYGWYMGWIERNIMGLRLVIRGRENLPKEGPYIIAAKHQSAYETLNLPFMESLNFPTVVLKKELTRIPIWGWYLWGMGQVAIDRGSGAEALQSIVRGCKRSFSQGRPVLIFPQGTRVPVGVQAPYKPGLAKVYRDLQVPIVPMALNSGLFWGRKAFFKKPGTIVYEFLPPIPAGLPPLQMMARLEQETETAVNRLCQVQPHD